MGKNDESPLAEWERQPGEPNRWFQWFERYRLLGPDRTLAAVFNQWRLTKSRGVSRSVPKSWRQRSEAWRWRARAEAWDLHCSSQAAAEAEAERLEILSSGYAKLHERVRALDELADLLLDELKQKDRRWLEDVKGIGSGRDGTFEKVTIERFNSAIIEQFRKTLEDLAAEMGERVKKTDITSGGAPLQVQFIEVIKPEMDEVGN